MAKIGSGLKQAAENITPEESRTLAKSANQRIERNAAFHNNFRTAAKPSLHVYGAVIVRY